MIINNPALSVRCTLSQVYRLNLLQCKASGGTGVDYMHMLLCAAQRARDGRKDVIVKEVDWVGSKGI